MSEDFRAGQADEPRDRQLADYYREAAREEPPVALDAAILAAARREVGSGPRAAASRRLRMWRLPVSIAAVVVLSVSVVTLMLERGEDRPSVPMRNGAAGTAPPSAAPPAQKRKADERRDNAAPDSTRTLGAPPAERPVAQAAPESVPPGDRGRAERAPATAAAPASVPDATQRDSDAMEDRGSARRDRQLRNFGALAPESAQEPPVAEENREPGPLLRSERSPAEMRAATRASPLGKPTSVMEYVGQPPEKWLDKIAELRRNGRVPEADELLAEFKKRYPEYPLPPPLR